MGRIFWVDNTAGNDVNSLGTSEYPYASITNAVAVAKTDGNIGDTIRICYTGQDYTYAEVTWQNKGGIGWGEGEHYTIEGYDRTGGTNRPKILIPSSSGYIFSFAYGGTYWKFTDLWFVYTAKPLAYNTGGIYIYTSIYDSDSYFKVRRCRFDAVYGASGTSRDQGIVTLGGGRIHFDIKHSFFYNMGIPFRMSTTAPACKGLNIQECVFYNPYRDNIGYMYLNTAGEQIDWTYSNNTCISLSSAASAGYFQYCGQGAIEDPYNFEFKNNFVFKTIYMFRDAGISSVDSDITNGVGYNSWGGLNNVAYGYHGDFAVCKTDGDGAVGDYVLQSTHSVDDYTSIFANYADWTYFWKESEWMTIPDLRPAGWEMTGTWEDPVAGLRGAIKWSGHYKDTTIQTNHYVSIKPYVCSNNKLLNGYPSASAVETIDCSPSTKYTMTYGGNGQHILLNSFNYVGNMANTYIDVESVSVKSGNYKITTKVYSGLLNPSNEEDEAIFAYTQLLRSGPEPDVTTAHSDPTKQSRINQVAQGFASGTYNIYTRYIVVQTGEESSWELAHSYTI